MALPRQTLGEMKAELRRRLGFASDGPSVQQNSLLLDDILQASQEILYCDYDFPELRRSVDVTVGIGQRFFDFPADCDPRNILTVATLYAQVWVYLDKGIDAIHDSLPSSGYAYRYDTAQMIELYPIPSQESIIRVEYKANLPLFTQEGHVCTLDSRLVLAHAIVEAKAHYGHQDVGLYQRQLDRLIRKMQAAAHHGNHYSRMGKPAYFEPLPQRV